MWKFWEYHLPVWKPEGEGAGGGGDGTPGETGDKAGGAGGDGQAPGGEGGGDNDAGAGDGAGGRRPSSIMDYANRQKPGEKPAEGKPGDPPAEWKLPDGVEVPDHLLGKTAEETLTKLSTAYKGARQELSTRKKSDGVLEGEVPKDAAGYKFDAGDGKDPVLADLASKESEPLLEGFRAKALELGIPDKAFTALMEGGIRHLTEQGVQLGAKAAEVNGEAEYKRLTETHGKDGADAVINQLDTFAMKMRDAGIIQTDKDMEEYLQMVGTARASTLMQRFIVKAFGEKAVVPGDGVDGQLTYEEAREALNAANALPRDTPDRQAKILRAESVLEQAGTRVGSGRTGQVRSTVL